MNIYKKFCPSVYVAECEKEHERGDEITLTTRYGKENEHTVHNFVGQKDGKFFYSITRVDGFNSQQRAEKRIERLNSWADSADSKSDEAYKASNKNSDFLSLGEPIKVGHHSEKRHRKMIEDANSKMGKSVELSKKAEHYRNRIAFWEGEASKIDLSMPESLDFFQLQLEEAIEYHSGLKDGSIQREHSYSLTYAKKRVNELQKKCKTAILLWGVNNEK